MTDGSVGGGYTCSRKLGPKDSSSAAVSAKSARCAAQVLPTRLIDGGATRRNACPVTTCGGNSVASHPATQPTANGDPRSNRAPARHVSLASAASCAPCRNAWAPAREHREVTLDMHIQAHPSTSGTRLIAVNGPLPAGVVRVSRLTP